MKSRMMARINEESAPFELRDVRSLARLPVNREPRALHKIPDHPLLLLHFVLRTLHGRDRHRNPQSLFDPPEIDLESL